MISWDLVVWLKDSRDIVADKSRLEVASTALESLPEFAPNLSGLQSFGVDGRLIGPDGIDAGNLIDCFVASDKTQAAGILHRAAVAVAVELEAAAKAVQNWNSLALIALSLNVLHHLHHGSIGLGLECKSALGFSNERVGVKYVARIAARQRHAEKIRSRTLVH